MTTIYEQYDNVLKTVKDYEKRVSNICNILNDNHYTYSMKIYQNKIFENIIRESNTISISNTTNIYQTLYNICILSINYLEYIKNVDKNTLMENNRLLFQQKNQDYGNSFQDYELIGILVRLNDKLNRIISITDNKNNIQVTDEKVEDTVNDLYNYCIIGLMYKPAY